MDFASYREDLGHILSNIEVTGRGGAALDPETGMRTAVDLILERGEGSSKIMLIGNGGSAAIASHMQVDLTKAVGTRAMVFTEQSLLTALSNDDGYETVYSTLIGRWAAPGDLLIAISSSGASPNIISGVESAGRNGCEVVTLSGFKPDNPLRSGGSVNFYVAVEAYGPVETAHSVIAHYLTDEASRLRREGATR